MNSESKLRILVLGCGSIGRRHITNLVTLEAGEVLVYDTDPKRLGQVAKELGVEPLDYPEQAWAREVDVVVIAVPTKFHIPFATEAVRHECDLFVEKPLSHRIDDAEALCDEIQRRDVVTLAACNMRFHVGPRTVKTLLQEDAIGEIITARLHTGSYLPRWRPEQDYRESYSADPVCGGAILDCIHEIDLALWYLGPARLVGACSTSAAAIGLETEGAAELMLQHDSGVISSLHLNFIQRDYRRTCQIIGTTGTIYWDMQGGRVERYGSDGNLAEQINPAEGWETNQMYINEMAHFMEAVKFRTRTVNPIPDALPALRLAVEARRIGRRNAFEDSGHHSGTDAVVAPAGQSAG